MKNYRTPVCCLSQTMRTRIELMQNRNNFIYAYYKEESIDLLFWWQKLRPYKQYSVLLSSKITVETKRKLQCQCQFDHRKYRLKWYIWTCYRTRNPVFIISKYNIGLQASYIYILEVKSLGIIFFSSVLSLVRVHQSRSKSQKILKSVDGDANPSSKQTTKQTNNNYLQ